MARMAQTTMSLAELAKPMQTMPQVLINVEVADKSTVAQALSVRDAVAKAEAELGDTGRILLRPSGTEQVVRVMVEASDADTAQMLAVRVAESVSEQRWNFFPIGWNRLDCARPIRCESGIDPWPAAMASTACTLDSLNGRGAAAALVVRGVVPGTITPAGVRSCAWRWNGPRISSGSGRAPSRKLLWHLMVTADRYVTADAAAADRLSRV